MSKGSQLAIRTRVSCVLNSKNLKTKTSKNIFCWLDEWPRVFPLLVDVFFFLANCFGERIKSRGKLKIKFQRVNKNLKIFGKKCFVWCCLNRRYLTRERWKYLKNRIFLCLFFLNLLFTRCGRCKCCRTKNGVCNSNSVICFNF